MVTPPSDIEILLESLRTRVEPVELTSTLAGFIEIGKFIEDVEKGLLACGLLTRKDRKPSEWHADPALKPYEFTPDAFQGLDVAYGFRNFSSHSNPGVPRTPRELQSSLWMTEAAVRRLVEAAQKTELVEAIYSKQCGDPDQRAGHKLAIVLDAIGAPTEELAELVDVHARELLRPTVSGTLSAIPDVRTRLRATIRRVAARCRGRLQLVALARRVLESLPPRHDTTAIRAWLTETEASLERLGSCATTGGTRRRVVRVTLSVPRDRPDVVRIDEVAIGDPLIPLEESERRHLHLPRETSRERLSDDLLELLPEVWRVHKAPMRRSDYILQLSVPLEYAYFEFDKNLDRLAYCLVLKPRVRHRGAEAPALRIATPNRMPTNSLAVDEPLSWEQVLARVNELRADCVFAAPELVALAAGTECQALNAFMQQAISIHFHSPAVAQHVSLVFDGRDDLGVDELLRKIWRLRNGMEGAARIHATILWDDPSYEPDPLVSL